MRRLLIIGKLATAWLPECEQASWMAPKTTLQVRDVLAESFEADEPFGYLAVYIFAEREDLSSLLARCFLQLCVPDPGSSRVPPGIGLAWLQLARQGLDPTIAPGRVIYSAPHMPDGFCLVGVEDDLLPLGRLILEGRGAIEAWDLHDLLAAVDRTNLRARALPTA
jgi:hypothetical protein